MSRVLARRGLSALLTLACAAAAILVALAPPAPSHGPAFALTGADGALALQNDREGAAILQAAGLRPGDVAEGTVALSATVPATSRSPCADEPGAEQPGTGGGLLSDRLTLAIDDVTVPGRAGARLQRTARRRSASCRCPRSRPARRAATASAPRSLPAPATTRSRARRSRPGSCGPASPPRRRARRPTRAAAPAARDARRRPPRRVARRGRRRAPHRPARGPRLRQAAPLHAHRQAAPRRQGQVGHGVRRRQARAPRPAVRRKGTLNLKAVERARRSRVRVVVATSAGTVDRDGRLPPLRQALTLSATAASRPSRRTRRSGARPR